MAPDIDARCPHGIPYAFAKCIECDLVWHEMRQDEVRKQDAYHSRRIAEIRVALAERVR
jgi:hypothetical protein